MLAYSIKINRLTAPVGIDAGKVLVSWLCNGGVKQTAYRTNKSGVKSLRFLTEMWTPGFYVY